MSRRKGADPAALPVTPAVPPAGRVTRPGWRDPRLWIGVAIVAASVVVGARVLAAADDTVAVWTLRADAGTGQQLTEDDLVSQQVHFADEGDLGRYFTVDDQLPSELTLLRAVGEGELVPRAAIGAAADTDTSEISLEVSPGQVPPSVASGSVVDVFLLATRGADAKGEPADAEPALAGVTVVDVPSGADTFGPSGLQQVVVAVPADQVAAFYGLLGSLDSPVISIAKE